MVLQGWSSSTAGKGSSSSSGSSSSVGGSVQAAGEPLLDLRVVNRLLPSGGSISGIPGDSFGPGDFDLEVEVEQEGGGAFHMGLHSRLAVRCHPKSAREEGRKLGGWAVMSCFLEI